MEHGWQGRYIEGHELAQQHNLKFVFGTEAYWVKDRFEKDRSNCHIYIAARNENGRQAINDVLAEANITGFYAQPRLDIPLLLSLPANDVILTSACIAYWRYDDIDDITIQLANHFRKNFFLEVQYHNMELQQQKNQHILELSKKHSIPIIMGCDSHYIYPKESIERTDYVNSKGLQYPDEQGFVLDYPDGQEAYNRFAKQGVLNHNQILDAMESTEVFLEVEEYECACFNHEIKMPTLYPNLPQEQKNKKYDDMVWQSWNQYKQSIPNNEWNHYEQEIQNEIDIVHVTKHADYFLIDNAIVEQGKKNGGVLTSTGRGSAVSFATNKLIGLTDVDRIAAKVKMYPERFMSPTRILETKSIADIDLNVADRDPFLKAQKEVLGEESSYEMIAYGTLKPKAAWKMYAKSQNVDFDMANKISEQIEKYEHAQKHAPEEEKDDVDVMDYIEKAYKDTFKQSEKYLGVISHMTPHPCATLLYQGNIRKEIGLINVKGKICCVMDGKWAEEYKFLKNDWLKVSVVDVINRIYQRIGRTRHTVNELLSICTPDNPVWDIYKKGCTIGINQVEQSGTAKRVSIFAPTNISELCAFVAAIRPGFKSMYKIFESRQHFEYGIPSLDKLVQTPEMPSSFVLYQESSMSVLNYAGVMMSECYEIIKNIAKKRVQKVLKYKEQFLQGFSKILIEQENQATDIADKLAHDVWQILEDSSAYSFNASHSYCVSIDSLYGAYLKTNYPVAFYETMLRMLEEKGDKDRLNSAKEEAEDYFKIKFPPIRFRQDNRNIVGDTETNTITNSITSIKGFGGSVGEALYEVGQHRHEIFVDVLIDLDKHGIKSSKVEPLIKIDYFSEFGNSIELLRINDIFNFFKQGAAKTVKKEKVDGSPMFDILVQYSTDKNDKGKELKSYTITDMCGLLKSCERYIKSLNLPDFDLKSKMANQQDILGYIDLFTGKEEDRRKLVLTDVAPLRNGGDPWGYALFTRSVGSGKTARMTLRANLYNQMPVKKMDIIYAADVSKNKSGYWYLNKYFKLT